MQAFPYLPIVLLKFRRGLLGKQTWSYKMYAAKAGGGLAAHIYPLSFFADEVPHVAGGPRIWLGSGESALGLMTARSAAGT